MTALYQTQDAISHCNEVAPLSENTAGVLVQNLYSIFMSRKNRIEISSDTILFLKISRNVLVLRKEGF